MWFVLWTVYYWCWGILFTFVRVCMYVCICICVYICIYVYIYTHTHTWKLIKHHTDRITHTTAFVTPVVELWLEREIAQWVHPMKDQSDDPSHHERTLYLWATSRSLVWNELQKCSMNVIFKQGPKCQKIFKSSISGVTPTNTDDLFNTSSDAPDQTLDLTLWDCLPFLVQYCWQYC